MKAVLFTDKDASICVNDVPLSKHISDDILIALSYSSINHRDLWISKGQYAKIQYPVIPGSDGSGTIAESSSSQFPIGMNILINPNINWGNNNAVQSSIYSILGMPSQGTMAEFISIPSNRIHCIPPHLSMEQAAALPLAGLTAFRAVNIKGAIQKGDTVLITGIGGGVALMAMQFAIALGAQVYVSSSDPVKIEKAKQLGAIDGVLYNQPNWHHNLMKLTPNGFDCIIDSAGGEHWNTLTHIAKPGGKIVFYGATQGSVPEFILQRVFWKQLTICGSTMGSDSEFDYMLDFVQQNQIVPIIDSIYSLDNAAAAFKHMESGNQFGKIVLQHS